MVRYLFGTVLFDTVWYGMLWYNIVWLGNVDRMPSVPREETDAKCFVGFSPLFVLVSIINSSRQSTFLSCATTV